MRQVAFAAHPLPASPCCNLLQLTFTSQPPPLPRLPYHPQPDLDWSLDRAAGRVLSSCHLLPRPPALLIAQ